MKVIVAGMPKTGTKTMRVALAALGYEVYDWLENFWYFSDVWVDAEQRGTEIEVLKKKYNEVDAVTDFPCCLYWQELAEAFPDAKIILTMRDEESWYKSMVEQWKNLSNDIQLKLAFSLTLSGLRCFRYRLHTFTLFGDTGRFPWSGFTLYNKETMMRMYRKHNRWVKEAAPKENLLEYRVQEGWEPLCEFLGVPKPQIDFPHKNKGSSLLAEFRKENEIMQSIQRELLVSLIIIGIGIAFFVRWLFLSWS